VQASRHFLHLIGARALSPDTVITRVSPYLGIAHPTSVYFATYDYFHLSIVWNQHVQCNRLPTAPVIAHLSYCLFTA
jgi:hypothetical protein